MAIMQKSWENNDEVVNVLDICTRGFNVTGNKFQFILGDLIGVIHNMLKSKIEKGTGSTIHSIVAKYKFCGVTMRWTYIV